MAIKVGRWDCVQCGYIGNLGPNTHCEKCGASRPENVEFYLSDDSKTVVDANKIRDAKSGADWVCSFCSGHNIITDHICQSCGNDRDATDGNESKFRIKKRFEKYFILIEDEANESYSEEVKFEQWDKTNLNDILIAEKSSVFGTFYGLKTVVKN